MQEIIRVMSVVCQQSIIPILTVIHSFHNPYYFISPGLFLPPFMTFLPLWLNVNITFLWRGKCFIQTQAFSFTIKHRSHQYFSPISVLRRNHTEFYTIPNKNYSFFDSLENILYEYKSNIPTWIWSLLDTLSGVEFAVTDDRQSSNAVVTDWNFNMLLYYDLS